MDLEIRKSLLWDAFEELKLKWSVDERILENLDEEDGKLVDGLPEERINDLMAIKEKYQLDDVDFLFIVGGAIGLYEGQKNVRNVIRKKIFSVNDFVSSVLGKK